MANDGLIFGIGTMTMTPEGGSEITLGVLQNVSIEISTSQQELRGGASLMPVKIAITERTVSGSAEFAKLDPNALKAILGGTMTTDTVPDPDVNTLTIKDTDKPVEFALVLSEPSDGSQLVITLNKCISTSFSMGFAYDNFLIPSFDFSAMADTNGDVMTIAMPV